MPKVVDHDQRRAELALALWQVIHEQGIDGVTFRAVAQAAGVSVERVQHYFPSKDDLVLHGCRQMVASAVVDHGPPEAPGDPRTAAEELRSLLIGAMSESVDFKIGASVWAAYQSKAASSPGIGAIVTDALAERARALTRLLAGARGRGGREQPAPTSDDRRDALRLAALSEGLTLRVVVGAVRADEARRVIQAEVDRCVNDT
ncbi:TetR/AcrR family transcriptional regulator [Dietzia aurantiaca]|uniref:TetR/AcrR family transcriptional regulator n=1 Tax=Dietzia aurantiaca TaxID=983873 RepID=A0ABV9PVW0_9ACTN